MIRHAGCLGLAIVLALVVAEIVQALERIWVGNANEFWSVADNWDPNGVPQNVDDIQIGVQPDAQFASTLVDQNLTINSLAMRLSFVDTSGNQLFVNTDVFIGPDAAIIVPPVGAGFGPGLTAGQIFLGTSGIPGFGVRDLFLNGEVGSQIGGLVQTSRLENVVGHVGGHGTIQLIDLGVGGAMINDGKLFVSGRPGGTTDRLPGTLTITGTGRLDLGGEVDVDDSGSMFNDTSLMLVIQLPLADAFSGQMAIGNNDTVNFVNNWTMDGGGANPAILNFNGTGFHILSGGALTVNGATTQVNLNGGATGFVGGLTFNDGQFTLADNATVQFNGATTFADASDITNGNLTMIVVNSSVDIGGPSVSAGERFDWDGAGSVTNETIVTPTGSLNINVEDIETSASHTYNSTITMNSGDINVQVSATPLWIMDGILNINNSASNIPILSGDEIQLGNDDAIDAVVNVGGTGVSRISAPIVFTSDADMNIFAGAFLETTGATTFQSVNGANNAEFTGPGTWRLAGTNTVNEATTINMTGGSVDLDNSSTAATVANDTFVNAPLTINAANQLTYGTIKNNGGSLSSSDLTVNHTGVNTGMLTVNTTASGVWTVNSEGTLLLFNDNTEATLLAGSALLFLDGVLNVTGDVRTEARLQILGTVSILTAGEPFRLSGGNLTDQPNTIVSGTIHGPGILGADTGMSLRGNGVINANVDFDGTAELLADGGILTINGAILDAAFVGTLDSDGILNVVNPWNTSTVGAVRMQGGELRGGTITNAAFFGIFGSGLVTSPVINNSALIASTSANTLRVETASNNNDWDGATNTGQLSAANGGILEIRDNLLFGFAGGVSATTNGTVFANGFELRFNTGSTLNLDAGTYRSTHNTSIAGTVSVGAGGGTLRNDQTLGFVFVSGSNATLNGNLRLESGTTINVGTTFSGGGELVNLALLRLVDNANVGVRIENQGDLEIGGMNTANIGQVTAGAFEQTAGGELIIHLGGIASGVFDHLQIGGAAQLDGALRLALTGGYVPVLGQGIEILMAELGVTGTFDSVMQPSGMPAGLMFAVQYGLKDVSLKVVVDAGLPGDFNDDGIVNAADYVVWRKTDGSQAGYDLWRANFGRTAGHGSLASGTVPEPATAMLLLAAIHIRLRRLSSIGSVKNSFCVRQVNNPLRRRKPKCRRCSFKPAGICAAIGMSSAAVPEPAAARMTIIVGIFAVCTRRRAAMPSTRSHVILIRTAARVELSSCD
jgi:hypothetical protein